MNLQAISIPEGVEQKPAAQMLCRYRDICSIHPSSLLGIPMPASR
jgi:hypothetical protein